MPDIAADVKVAVKGSTDQGSLAAGNAKALGSAAGGGSLSYEFRPAAQEMLSVALVAYNIAECTAVGEK